MDARLVEWSLEWQDRGRLRALRALLPSLSSEKRLGSVTTQSAHAIFSHAYNSAHRAVIENRNTARDLADIGVSLDVCFGNAEVVVKMKEGVDIVRGRGNERDRSCS